MWLHDASQEIQKLLQTQTQSENTAEASENGVILLPEQLWCNQSFIINETAIPTLHIWNN